jgi:competence protein ComEC
VVKFLLTLPDGNLHVVFCDVGQGDAVYIRTPQGTDIVIDGGPDVGVLECLGKHLPFYDRTIELVILSHPQSDHITGLIEIIKRYHVLQIINSSARNETKEALLWEKLIKEKNVRQVIAEKGQKVLADRQVVLNILWPNVSLPQKNDVNELSTVVLLRYQNFSVLFTGDISGGIAEQLSFSSEKNYDDTIELQSTILKVPHHGSKFGLSKKFLEEINPSLAIISVGKNSYGHPNSETIKLLNSLGINILRTDQNKTIEIISNGSTWYRH